MKTVRKLHLDGGQPEKRLYWYRVPKCQMGLLDDDREKTEGD